MIEVSPRAAARRGGVREAARKKGIGTNCRSLPVTLCVRTRRTGAGADWSVAAPLAVGLDALHRLLEFAGRFALGWARDAFQVVEVRDSSCFAQPSRPATQRAVLIAAGRSGAALARGISGRRSGGLKQPPGFLFRCWRRLAAAVPRCVARRTRRDTGSIAGPDRLFRGISGLCQSLTLAFSTGRAVSAVPCSGLIRGLTAGTARTAALTCGTRSPAALLTRRALGALGRSRFLLPLPRLLALRGAGSRVAAAVISLVRLFGGRTCLLAALLSGRPLGILFRRFLLRARLILLSRLLASLRIPVRLLLLPVGIGWRPTILRLLSLGAVLCSVGLRRFSFARVLVLARMFVLVSL